MRGPFSADSGPADLGPLAPGLHLVATPIGAARDITLRALDVLATADVLAAEDTRTLRRLMDIHGIAPAGRPMVAYHDHNGAKVRPRLLRALAEGRSVAYASDAGTPLVADPGYRLAREAIAEGHRVHAVPGASAVLAALAVSGLPSDRFLFAGFPPVSGGARQAFLREVAAIPATVILYESPKRVGRLLRELTDHCGEERGAALCRELTKRFEEVRRGPLGVLAQQAEDDPPRGEVVVVLDRAAPVPAGSEAVEAALRAALERGGVRDAAAEVAAALGLPRRDMYRMALDMMRDEGGQGE